MARATPHTRMGAHHKAARTPAVCCLAGVDRQHCWGCWRRVCDQLRSLAGIAAELPVQAATKSCPSSPICQAILACRQRRQNLVQQLVSSCVELGDRRQSMRGRLRTARFYHRTGLLRAAGIAGQTVPFTTTLLSSDKPLVRPAHRSRPRATFALWCCTESAHHLGTLSLTSAARSPYQQSAVGGHGGEPSADARTKQSIATFCTTRTVSKWMWEWC